MQNQADTELIRFLIGIEQSGFKGCIYN